MSHYSDKENHDDVEGAKLMTQEELKEILAKHKLWLAGEGGAKAHLQGANLMGAYLEGANLQEANLQEANLQGANLQGANLQGSNLQGADLQGANLRGPDLLCFGNMQEIRTMQIDTWSIGYTADTLQIGCQKHPIYKWRKWNTPAGRKWIKNMDENALEWADRNLGLVLAMMDANPATPTGHEEKADD